MRQTVALRQSIELADRHSRFLRNLVRRFPDWPDELCDNGPNMFLSEALRSPGEDVAAALRRQRARTAYGTAIADIAGVFSLSETTSALSLFADHAVREALRLIAGERYGEASLPGFTIIALGKLGSRSLNYSSDIDLIYLFDGERLPTRSGKDPGEEAHAIARRLGEILQRPSRDGYVARVDLRLRPDAEGMGLATPIRRAELYYQAEALTWERAAMIKARHIAGDIELAREFFGFIHPFVWRRALDYTAIRAVEDMSLRIRDHFEGPVKFGPGFDLKRGRGGIREIEFFAQAQQLIFGGRDETLRAAPTREALAALAASGRIDTAAADRLTETYTALRSAEHRVQMLEDEQTHAIPARKEDRAALAALSGKASFTDLANMLRPAVADVRDIYDAFLESAEQPAIPRGRGLKPWLAAEKLPARAEFERLIDRWRGGTVRALRSDAAQGELEHALPNLIAAFGALTAPLNALRRFDDFLMKTPSVIRVLALLAANPAIAKLLARVMGHAPRLAAHFARNPELLDTLIMVDRTALPNAAAFRADFSQQLMRAQGAEAVHDGLRRWSREQRFRVGTMLIERLIDPLVAGRAYSDIADAVIDGALRWTLMDFAEDHGRIEGAVPIVLAMGRHGGRMLTETSDLDLVFLYTPGTDGRSDGAKAHDAPIYFNRLFQRLVSTLSVATAAGPLYEVDTRLRPSGAQGALAVSVEAFRDYQLSSAWTWEHMALTRARVVTTGGAQGSNASEAAESAIGEALMQDRDPAALRKNIIDMRRDMNAAHPARGPLDVKHGAGGLIDLEFVVHYLQLRERTALVPDLGQAIAALAEKGCLPASLLAAHDLMTRFLILMRLVEEEAAGRNSAVTRGIVAAACGADDWTSLLAAISEARKAVGAAWQDNLGEKAS
ncbi:MAG: bifunctional [glutamate--ammonia ligase]-adenylyl-L-tyrosine phosphorylase/[glutamate--ammonia-ligase] adenylyltransferase [Pacificimonas sp.]|nr:bifunctional [glutamate--ammonia ligase]-adenylyl-L-tyrosine phosphorylase/[glutamate--ammonia-ligase] adenylyltransferase [Pacificimonas sp.]